MDNETIDTVYNMFKAKYNKDTATEELYRHNLNVLCLIRGIGVTETYLACTKWLVDNVGIKELHRLFRENNVTL